MADKAQQKSPSPEGKAGQEPADNLPENKVDVEDAGTLKKKVTITVPRERIDAKFDDMFGELRKTAQVPGFRIGHAPHRLIEKRFGKEVSQDVRNALIGESLGSGIKKTTLKTLGEPEIDLDAIELPETGEMTFSFEVEIQPEFDLPRLKGIPVEKTQMEVTDGRIDEYLEELRQSRARYDETDTAAADGDVVAAGVKISGEGIEPLEKAGLTLRVAPGQIEGLPLVDLGKALSGKKAAQKAELTIKVPQAHPQEAWRDKELTVEITISQVRRRVLPELNEEFARQMGFETLKEMREFLATRLGQRLEQESQRSMRDQVCRYLLDKTSFDLPEGVAKRHAARLVQRQQVDMLQRGIPREKIEERITELQAAASEQAQHELKLRFILGKIAKEQSIEVSEAEINARIAQMAGMYNRRPERLRQELTSDGSLGQLEVALREEKALETILGDAKITEAAEPAKKEKPAPKAKKTAKKSAKKPARKASKKTPKKSTSKKKKA